MQRSVPIWALGCALLFSACSSGTPSAVATAVPTETQEVPTATSTPAAPMIQIGVEADCYDRPDGKQALIARIPAGQVIPAAGKDGDGNYWVVVEPQSQSGCWIAREGTTEQGNTDDLPSLVPPPTAMPPAPPANFKAKKESCIKLSTRFDVVRQGKWTAVIHVTWDDNADDVDKLILLRGDHQIAELPADQTEYWDTLALDSNAPRHLSYSLLAWSEKTGTSERATSEFDLLCQKGQ